MILETALTCLALNIYMEARSEMIPGQYAVASVTLNRAKQAKNVCRVVTEKDQFSWTRGRLMKRKGQYVLKRGEEPTDERAWALAKHIAAYSLKHRQYDFVDGATHYHTVDIRPYWAKSMRRTHRYGAHVFYRTA